MTTTATRTSQINRMNKTITEHVRCKSLYILLPSSANREQREMTKFCVVYGTWTTTANFSYLRLELNAIIAYFAKACFKNLFRTEQI